MKSFAQLNEEEWPWIDGIRIPVSYIVVGIIKLIALINIQYISIANAIILISKVNNASKEAAIAIAIAIFDGFGADKNSH